MKNRLRVLLFWLTPDPTEIDLPIPSTECEVIDIFSSSGLNVC